MVVRSSSHAAHYGYASEAPFHQVARLAGWLEFEFIEEHSLDRLQQRLESDQVDGIVFASGCLQSVSISEALSRALLVDQLRSAYERGVGMCFLHQTMPVTTTFTCEFVPARFRFTVSRHEETTALDSPLECADLRLAIDRRLSSAEALESLREDSRGHRARCWTNFVPDQPSRWRPCAWLATHPHQPLISTVASTGPSIITCSLALDWNRRFQTLAAIAAECAKARGVALFTSQREAESDYQVYPYLHTHASEGRFVHSFDLGSDSDTQPIDAFYFDTVVFGPSWRLSTLPSSFTKRVRGRLERGGSVAAFVDGAEWHEGSRPPVLIEVAGPPQYVARAQWYAEWLLNRRGLLAQGFTFDLRAVAIAVVEINRVFADRSAIPAGLQLDEVRPLIAEAIDQRSFGRDNIDNQLLPTAACAHALLLVGDEERADPLVNWLKSALAADEQDRGLWFEDHGAVSEAHARLWIPALQTADDIRSWLAEHGDSPDVPHHLQLALRLRLDQLDGVAIDRREVDEMIELVTSGSVTPAVQAEIFWFLIHHGLAVSISDLAKISPLLVDHLQALATSNGGVEAVSMLVAAMVSLEDKLPPQITYADRASSSPAEASEDASAVIVPLERAVAQLRERLVDRDKELLEARQLARRGRHVARAWALFALIVFVCADVLLSGTAIATGYLGTDAAMTLAASALSVVAVTVGVARWFHVLPWDRPPD